jgi:hypothetical protein
MSDQISKLQDLAATQLGMDENQMKPLVQLPGKGVQIRDTAKAIYEVAAAQKGLFYSGGLVVKLGYDGTSALPILTPLVPAAAMSEFEKYVRFGKAGGKDDAETVLNEGTTKAILLCDVAKDILPNVRGLLNHPLPFLHNGQIEILKPGYNCGTGLLVSSGEITEPDTVDEAVRIIQSIFIDFTFQAESDISRAIACFLTPALKIGGFISGHTPLNIIEADESQTGKGFILQLRSLLYGEVPRLVSRQKGGVGSVDESFATALISGRPFIQFDNFRGELKSEFLEAFLTNPASLLVRTPYSAPQPVDGSQRFVSITSNGMVTTEDLANRASFVRLNKEENREFTLTDGKTIDEMIVFARHHFIGAITKIIRHYHDLGMPKTNERRHDFREWAQKLDWIVQNIFKLPPLMDGHEAAQQRVQNPALAFVRVLAIQVEKVGRLRDELKAQDLADICETGGIEIPGLNKKGAEGYTEMQEAQRIGQLLGQAMGIKEAIDVEAYRVIRSKRLGLTSGGNSFSGKRYEFRHITKQAAETQELHFDI